MIKSQVKIGIITIHSDFHHGAALQAFATAKVLNNNGYNAKVIDYIKIPTNLPKLNLLTKILYQILSFKRIQNFKSFLKPVLDEKQYHSVESIIHNFNEDYDIILTGSDQVWNPVYSGLNKLNPVYFAAFADSRKYKKIAYASSIGSHMFTENEILDVKKWLGDYKHISTRELFGKTQLEQILNKDVSLVLDPTLLLNKYDWQKISTPPTKKIKFKYVLVYNVGSTIGHDAEFAKHIANKLNCKVVFMSIKWLTKKNIDVNIPHCGPAEFVWLFANAQFIVTSSFHGVAFSVNLNKNFVNIYNPKSPERTNQLLTSIGLEHRTIHSIENLETLELSIDYSKTNQLLEKQRKQSLDYLINAIEN